MVQVRREKKAIFYFENLKAINKFRTVFSSISYKIGSNGAC